MIPKYKIDEYRREMKQRLQYDDEKLSKHMTKNANAELLVMAILVIAIYASIILGVSVWEYKTMYDLQADSMHVTLEKFCAFEDKGEFIKFTIEYGGTLFPTYDKTIIYCTEGNIVLRETP